MGYPRTVGRRVDEKNGGISTLYLFAPRICVCVCSRIEKSRCECVRGYIARSREDAKNRETRKTCATTSAKWKHFFEAQSGVPSLRVLKSQAHQFVLTRWAQNLSQVRNHSRADVSKRAFEPFRCRRELMWHGALPHDTKGDLILKIKPAV